MPLANRYTLTVTPGQARVIQEALELLARCHMGQFNHVTWQVAPMADRWETERHEIGLKLAIWPELSSSSYYGISNEKVADEARVAWDLYTLVRHRLAWDRRTAEDEAYPLTRIMVQYDEPTTLSKEPKASIEWSEP